MTVDVTRPSLVQLPGKPVVDLAKKMADFVPNLVPNVTTYGRHTFWDPNEDAA